MLELRKCALSPREHIYTIHMTISFFLFDSLVSLFLISSVIFIPFFQTFYLFLTFYPSFFLSPSFALNSHTIIIIINYYYLIIFCLYSYIYIYIIFTYIVGLLYFNRLKFANLSS